MQFLSLASAWFAVALPAIAVMYILKRTYQDKEIASHLLWKRVLQEQEANRPWQKLRSRWLLLLQLLAALLLVLALMEPILSKPAAATGHAVLFIDRSASMTARPSDLNQPADATAATRLELAVTEAEKWLDEQPKRREVTVVVSGAQPEVLANRETDRGRIKQLLDSISPFYGKTDNAAALSLADSLLQGDPSGQTLLFTDGEWPDAEEANALQLLAPVDMHKIDGGDEGQRGNVSILYFGIKADATGNGTNRGVITVRNDSLTSQAIQVDLFAEQADKSRFKAGEASVKVAPGEWQSVEVSNLPEAVYYKAQLRQMTDAALADNSAYQFPEVPKTKQALIVSEGNLFLEKALLLAGVKPVKINPDSAVPTGENAEAIDWILLDGMNERLLADAGWSKLLAEKPVWMIDHPDQTDETAAVPAHTRVETKEHPVTAYITLSDTHIGRLAKPDPAQLSWGEAVLSYGGIPAIYAGTAEGKPRLRFTFNFQDTDLPLRPEFPVLVVQAAQWMSEGSQLELGTAIAEQSIEVSLHSDTAKAEWQAVELAGAGLKSEQALINQSIESDITASGLLVTPPVPGLYRLVERNSADRVVGSRLLAVTVDYPELLQGSGNEASELRPAAIADPSDFSSAAESQKDSSRIEQVSLQIWVAVLLLLLMSAEWEVYRRGHTS